MEFTDAFRAALEKYGQPVQIFPAEGAGTACRAFVQPLWEKKDRWQAVPTPLGAVCPDRWLYLGPPEMPLEGMEGGYLQMGARRFAVMRAQPVYLGGEVCHWRAVLAQWEEGDVL